MKPIAILFNLILFVMLVGACGPSARQKTIHGTFVSINIARDGFVAYDARTQQTIVQLAMTLDEGRKNLEKYRQRREIVVKLFEGAYRALAAAAIVNDDPKSITNLVSAAALLKSGLDDFLKETQ